jgi:hypothetical protein
MNLLEEIKAELASICGICGTPFGSHNMGKIEECFQAVPKLTEALRPFATMHRIGSDPSEVACQRGTASDLTIITSGDFQRAYEALPLKDDEGDPTMLVH